MEDLSSSLSSSPAIEADLARLEADLRQLKVHYDMFFAGALARQPLEMKADFERLLKRCSGAPPHKYAHRFQLNALVSRYHSLSELWSKALRSIEEGDRPAAAVLDRVARERILASCRVRNPVEDQAPLRALHERFLEARKRAGVEEGSLAFDSFLRGVATQARRLEQKYGCDEIELRIVVENRKVQLKARPGR